MSLALASIEVPIKSYSGIEDICIKHVFIPMKDRCVFKLFITLLLFVTYVLFCLVYSKSAIAPET